MGVSTGEPPAQVGSLGGWEHSQSSAGLVGGAAGVVSASCPWSSQHQPCWVSWHS